ncbi:PREDICTED: uncharacterized protein LOC101296653 [Fragaria vesca subsp. vesca]|uniref:uncharacterized protein LOC101296653 n=1 Tax=Fragaria vesca subsp. vesca TaxID=101020 RepID=UPI0002C2EF7D|nr:PREDICTED: uncharacterized protein LOC101296653 [Fragaria vesca subsp. vesca]
MTLPDWTLLNFVFREPCKGVDDSSYVVASFCDIILTKSEIDYLRPSNKIYPKVMNIWAAYLSDKHSDSWFLPASFGERACDSKLTTRRNWMTTIIEECGLHRFNRRFKHCSKILVPLLDVTSNHWFLLVTRPAAKVVEIWDTKQQDISASTRTYFESRRLNMAICVMKFLHKVFSNDMTRPRDTCYHIRSFQIDNLNVSKNNVDRFDSGVYVMKQMQGFGEVPSQFQSIHERSVVSLSIVKDPKNEKLKSMKEAAGLKQTERSIPTKPVGIHTYDEADSANCDNIPKGRKSRSHRRRRGHR